MTSINVTKRSGETEQFNIDKIHRVLEWACQDLVGVSVSEIEMRANVQLYDKMRSTSIHDLLIKSTAELITEATPNYQTVAARLINYKLKKVVYGDKDPWSLKDIINHNVEAGVYDPDILNMYSESELDYINNNIVDHSRDDDFTYAGMEQMRSKYLVQNRSDGTIYETPQVLYIMIAMTLFGKYNGDKKKGIAIQIKVKLDAIAAEIMSVGNDFKNGQDIQKISNTSASEIKENKGKGMKLIDRLVQSYTRMDG